MNDSMTARAYVASPAHSRGRTWKSRAKEWARSNDIFEYGYGTMPYLNSFIDDPDEQWEWLETHDEPFCRLAGRFAYVRHNSGQNVGGHDLAQFGLSDDIVQEFESEEQRRTKRPYENVEAGDPLFWMQILSSS